MALTNEQKETVFNLFKHDINRRNFDPDALSYVYNLIDTADAEIRAEGYTPDYTAPDDLCLCSMYAAYLYTKRRADGDEAKMPRMLRWALNQRHFGDRHG